MQSLGIKFEKPCLRMEGKIIKEYIREEEIWLDEHINELKEKKKMPYAIASDKFYELWKFFMIFRDGKMQFLKNPRYKIRKGQHWFKVLEIVELGFLVNE